MNNLLRAIELLDKKEIKKINLLFLIMIMLSFLEFFSLGSVLLFLNFFVLGDMSLIETGFLSKINIEKLKDLNLATISLGIMAIFFIKNSLSIFNISYSTKILNSIRINISKKLYRGYLSEDINSIQQRNLSTYQRNIINEGHAFTLYLGEFINYILQILTLLLILGLSLIYNYKISLLIFSILGILFIFYFKIFKKTLTIYGEKRKSISKNLLNLVDQTFSSIREIKIYSLENRFIDEFIKENVDLKKISVRRSIIGNFPRIFWELLLVVGVFTSIIYFHSIGKELDKVIGLFSTYIIIAIRLIPSFSQLARSKNSLEYAKSSINTFYENAKYVTESKNIIHLDNTIIDDVNLENLKISNLSFSFKNTNKKIFDNTEIEFNKGDFIFIYGENGVGKTTFFDIMTGLLKPNKINFIMNGINISNLNRKINFSYIAQNSFLFDDTIENNILLNKEKTLSDVNSNKIIEISDLKNLINNLPNKEKTIIGENGIQLSGGEKQKVALARALYNRPKLLLTDEFTNAIDEKSEKLVLNQLKEYKELDIFIMISHNRNLDHMFNKVYELKNQKFRRVK